MINITDLEYLVHRYKMCTSYRNKNRYKRLIILAATLL